MDLQKFMAGVLVVLTLAVGYLVYGSMGMYLGKASGPSHFQHESFLQGLSAGVRDQFTVDNSGQLTLGLNGTKLTTIKAGSCTIWSSATTIAASSTQQVVCQSATNGTLTSGLTGVTSDSICSVRIASSTNTTYGGLVPVGVSASSTPGSIVVGISNQTGATFTWSAAASSSPQWKYACFDPA